MWPQNLYTVPYIGLVVTNIYLKTRRKITLSVSDIYSPPQTIGQKFLYGANIYPSIQYELYVYLFIAPHFRVRKRFQKREPDSPVRGHPRGSKVVPFGNNPPARPTTNQLTTSFHRLQEYALPFTL